MDIISSKEICKLICDTLGLLDKRPVQHGERTSYILYKMIQDSRKYEKYQIADFTFIANLHDVGAYKTEDLNDSLKYESKDHLRHSVYGYLIMKNLSPCEELSKVILYHHTDYTQSVKINYEYTEIAMLLHLAETVDIYKKAMGPKFNLNMFNKFADTKFSKKNIERLNMMESRYDIMKHIEDESYKEELETIRKYLVFNKRDNKKLLDMLMYFMGFRSDYAVADAFSCVTICRELAKKLTLTEEDANILYYAAVVHDIGMMSIPTEILEAPRKLTDNEVKLIRSHVESAGVILKGKMKESVMDVALSHHERFDGSGYPKKMTASAMTMPMAILQVADTVSALIGERNYRIRRTKNDVCTLLREEARRGRFHNNVVEVMIENYDQIMESVKLEGDEVKMVQHKLHQQYNQTIGGALE